uniref:Acylase n=1 Tax=Kluyvera cryocrescens TaxID=580 RepID=Q7M124_KLUCR
CNMWVIGK